MAVVYKPTFERSAQLVRNLTEASMLVSWIREQTMDVSWIAPAQRDTMIRLAHSSTRIEGNPLTLPEVAALANGEDLSVEEDAKREVLNYLAALRWIWRKSSPTKIEESMLLKLHKILTTGLVPITDCGKYKTKPNAIFQSGRVIYQPPPPEAAHILTRSLLTWLNSSHALAEHAVIVASIAHHRLVSIHPFLDGNGRISRALGCWILFRRGFDTQHVFALDEFFDADRKRYYFEIQEARDRKDDLTSWIEYVSEGIIDTLHKTQVRIRSLKAKAPSTKIQLNRRQERLLQVLGQSSFLGGGELARSLGLTRSHLSKILGPLLKAKLVVKEGSTKAAMYRLA